MLGQTRGPSKEFFVGNCEHQSIPVSEDDERCQGSPLVHAEEGVVVMFCGNAILKLTDQATGAPNDGSDRRVRDLRPLA